MDASIHLKNMNPLNKITVMMALSLFWLPVQAELEFSGSYYGVQFSDSRDKFDGNAGTVEQSRGHLKGKYGWIMGDLLALETQLGVTTNSDHKTGILTYGAYARMGKDFGQSKVYGLAGVGGIYAYDDNFDDVSEAGASIGAGLEVFGSKDIAITLEYLRILDKSVSGGDLTFDTLGFGFTYYFTEDTSFFNKNRNKIDNIRD
jgi:hypothetical protein